MFKGNEAGPSKNQIQPIPCIYHPENAIQNFCKNLECLLPMCSICVGIHAFEHQSKNTFPNICSILDAVTSAKKELTELSSILQEKSNIYTADYALKQKIQQECYQTLANLKEKILREVQMEFSAIQAKVFQQIERFDSKIYQRYQQIEHKTTTLYSDLEVQLSSLTKKDLALKTLIRFHAQQLKPKIQAEIRRIQQAISQLKSQRIWLIIKPQLFELVQNLQKHIFCQQLPEAKFEVTQTSPRSMLSQINFHYGKPN